MFPLLFAAISFAIAFGIWKLAMYISTVAHKRKLGNEMLGPEGHPLVGMALKFAPMDSAELMSFLLEQADLVRSKGENTMRFHLAGETFCIPLNGEAIKPILESKDEITKGIGYDFLLEWLGTGLLISDGKKWYSRRKLITPTFHFKHLENYVDTFNRESKIFSEVIGDLNGEEFDALPYIKRCALDVICASAMGATVGAQRNPSHPFVQAIRDFLWLGTEYAMKAQNWFPPYWHLSGRAALYKDSLRVLHGFTRQIISERKALRAKGVTSSGRETNFLDMLLEHNDSGELNDEDIREEVDTFMFEGHDTTSTGVAWTLWCLAHHHDVQQKLYEEIVDLVGPDDEPITSDHLKDMTYLDQVIKESFRLYSPVPMVNRRLHDDFKSGKHVFPKNSIVSIAPILLARNKQVWGDDVESFDPERFSAGGERARHPFDYIPFSAGPRNCIGQRFALFETKVMVSWVVRSFRLSSQLAFKDNRCGGEAVLCPMSGIPIRAEKRL